jgi:signal transduction histidine kinase/ActR/RegA family two-component response regulator
MPIDDERAREPASGARRTPPEPQPDRQSLLEQLRDANEQLVVGSMRAQGLADEADASRADAETANRLKDEFLAILSHELRTPLSAVLGWASLLGSGQLDPARTVNAIRTIERNAKLLARIIDDLLDISRIIAGNVRIESLPLDLVAVIQGALDEVRLAAEVKGVSLTFSCQAVPDPVGGDALRLQQVVANLASNAVKFTPAGGQVEVRLSSAGSEAEIQVADTGKGVAPEFLPHIFERFTQADTSTTRRLGGVGLGLSIVKALVELHGGTVRADSPGPGRGATFTVRIPVLAPRDAAEVERRVTQDEAMEAAVLQRLDGVSVLLVEDDADGRQVLTVILELAGAKVNAVGSVRGALAALADLRPDVLVSDVGMPDEDGYALIRHIRAREASGVGGMPAIALTGYATPDDCARLLAAGFQLYLRKPVDPSQIVAAVASLAHRRLTPRADDA